MSVSLESPKISTQDRTARGEQTTPEDTAHTKAHPDPKTTTAKMRKPHRHVRTDVLPACAEQDVRPADPLSYTPQQVLCLHKEDKYLLHTNWFRICTGTSHTQARGSSA